jgi:hypothetical protein
MRVCSAERKPESAAPESGMPGFEHRRRCFTPFPPVTFDGPVQPAGKQETEAFREGEGVKASQIQGIQN